MEKFKTLNNSYAKDFVYLLSQSNLRACSYLLYNCRNMYIKKTYYMLCRLFFSHFDIEDTFYYRSVARILDIDILVVNHIVKLCHEWKGGVFDE